MTDADTVRVRAVMDEAMMAYQPLKTQGQPADVAEAALFLASNRARQITGVVLPVEGGITAGDSVNRSAMIRESRERVLAQIRAERG
jgi:NAD(P)-dependent dehydrogenase (short-subunit alcohol dehydrogenase family)